jgi:hypothetical protein
MFTLRTSLFHLVQFLTIGGDLVAQSAGQQGVVCLLQVLGGVTAPANLVSKFGRVSKRRRVHGFDILLVLLLRAGRNLIHPLAVVRFPECLEAVEGGKKLIVAADSRRRHKVPHRKRIDHGIVKILVLECISGGHGAFAASALRLDQGHGRRLHAEPILHRVANEGLGIHRAPTHVKMQVTPLRHTLQKDAQCQRVLAGCCKRAHCALLCGVLRYA